MRHAYVAVAVLALLCALPLQSVADGAEKQRCAHCGMLVDDTSPFSARMVLENKTLWFCDIGDMALYLREKKGDPAQAQVKDYPSGAWIPAAQAFYVSSPKKFRTPMGWGLAAFRDRSEASASGDVDDLASILKRIQ